jgi:cytochrome c
MLKKMIYLLIICVFAAGSVYSAEKSTAGEAKKMVEMAAAYITANGEEAAIKEINKSDGKFVKGDLYVFAYDMNAVMKAHPIDPKLIGQKLYDKADSKGKLFRKEIVELAKSKGSGFVDYTYRNPVTKVEEPKTTYIQKVGNLIVCCGAYK